MSAHTMNICHPDYVRNVHSNDLNNMVSSPSSELPAAKPSSPEILKCILAGAESDDQQFSDGLGG